MSTPLDETGAAIVAHAKEVAEELARNAGTTLPLSDLAWKANYAIVALLAHLDAVTRERDVARDSWLLAETAVTEAELGLAEADGINAQLVAERDRYKVALEAGDTPPVATLEPGALARAFTLGWKARGNAIRAALEVK